MTLLAKWAFFGLAVVIAAVAAGLDLPKALGAHPWWSQKVVGIGAGVGLVIALIATALRATGPVWYASLALLVSAAAITGYGKTQFAASFAEDAVAGRMWYFGWIAICATAFVAIALLGTMLRRKAH